MHLCIESSVMVGLGVTVSHLTDAQMFFILDELLMIGFDRIVVLLKCRAVVSLPTDEFNLMHETIIIQSGP